MLLKKGVYRYECMVEQENFNETLLPKKEDFYSDLKMKDIKDAD